MGKAGRYAPVAVLVCVLACGKGGGGTTGKTPHLTTILLSPADASIAVGDTLALTAAGKDQDGAAMSGVVFNWASSNAAAATVADGVVTGVAAGSATITAASGGITSNGMTLTVSAATASTTDPSDALIAQDVASGKITEEQGFVFRVYAAFGSPALPVKYRSSVVLTLDSPIGRELPKRFSTLSPAAQSAVTPYLMPPIYKGSWGDAATAPAGPVAPPRSRTLDAVDCASGLQPTGWATKTTANFRIHYRSSVPSSNWYYTTDQAEQAASNIAAVAENVRTKLTGLFQKEPLSDANLPCNGGDGAFDVYVDRMSISNAGMTTTYPPGCSARPAWMWIAPDRLLDPEDARDIFTHEYMHAIDFAYSKGFDCTEYAWLSEAAGNWAIDFVYPNDQFEQIGLLQNYAPCYYRTDYAVPIEESERGPLGGCNGYSDYVFLFFLARKHQPDTIKRIFEYAELFDSQDSLDNATSAAGGLKKVWPEFALAGWNDWTNHVHDDFYTWDQLKEGRKLEFDTGDGGALLGGDKSTQVALQGAHEKTFVLSSEFNAGLSGDSHTIEPLGARYVYLKFTDDTVRSIVFSNKPAWLMQPRLHVDALMKINGEWKPEEDWTAENFKSFCRDSKEERLEELVVIYSNSDPVRPRETTVVRLDGIPGLPGDVDFIPKVDASNAGCWRWEGTSKITTTDTYGLKIETSATVTFDRVRATGESPDGAGQELYSTKAQAGPATYSINGPFLGTCDVTGSGSGAIADSDGIMNIRFNQPKDLDNRVVLSGDGTSAMSVTQTVTCPNSPPQTTTQSVSPAWMSLPDNSALSEDGQTISGKLVESDAAGGTKVTEWNLTAARE